MATKAELLKVQGMHCAACAILIDKTLEKTQGIVKASANYGSERLSLEYDPSVINIQQIGTILNKIGYSLVEPKEGAEMEEEDRKTRERELRKQRNLVLISFVLAIPIIGYYMPVHIFNIPHVHQLFGLDLNWYYWLITTPIQFGVGYVFYRNAIAALKVGSTNMDVLVVLGTTAAYVFSFVGFFVFPLIGLPAFDHPFWESSAALVTFIMLGRYFESLAKGKTSESIRKLLDLRPKTATVIRDRQEVQIPVDQVKIDDIIVVKPGETIPVDGIVIDGRSSVDEKVITGESMPVSKEKGSIVIGATLNKNGVLKFKTTKVGRDTLLQQIIRMVEEAQSTRAPIQRLADKISEYFVPIVVLIAAFAFAFWYGFAPFLGLIKFQFSAALLLTAAVLLISCPCAMGLATPTAIMVGTGKGAENGILIKGGEALEKAYKMNAIAFDKTGTLTKGEPAVTDIVAYQGSQDDILRLAALVEQNSEHPLAKSVVERAKSMKLSPVKSFEALPGLGVKATYLSKIIMVGNEMMMEKNNIDISQYRTDVDKLQNEAKTVIFVVMNKKILGLLALADTLKPFSKEAVSELKKLRLEVIMITGDNEKTAKAMADQLGIDKFYAKVLPQDKAKVIKELQSGGKVVGMVGDGINDAPALAQADIGIAIGSGTDVAIETGNIVLIKEDLRDVVTSIDLSRKTINKIKQNLFWAFFYNIIFIPVAAGALYPIFGFTLRPEFAGIAMAMSSISVTSNSLLLKRYRSKIASTIVK